MDMQQFIEKRPYLYHLTSKVNAPQIIGQKKLLSSNELIKMSKDKENLPVQRQKRKEHYALTIAGQPVLLRDQRPISEKALSKCLTDNWQVGDFLYHLNDRVFLWPTIERLMRHYNRYKNEELVIFRFQTSKVLEKNKHVKFCRLNSGATRANSHLGGIAPQRGPNTFLPPKDYNLSVGSVAEVTFEKSCLIDFNFTFGKTPTGPFHPIEN